MQKFFFIFIAIFMTSCVNQDYVMVRDHNGRKLYLKKQKPKYNELYLEQQKQQDFGNVEFDSRREVNEKPIKEITKASTAYEIKSVIDNNLNAVEHKKIIEKNSETQRVSIAKQKQIENDQKTIEDFKNLPDYLFEDKFYPQKDIRQTISDVRQTDKSQVTKKNEERTKIISAEKNRKNSVDLVEEKENVKDRKITTEKETQVDKQANKTYELAKNKEALTEPSLLTSEKQPSKVKQAKKKYMLVQSKEINNVVLEAETEDQLQISHGVGSGQNSVNKALTGNFDKMPETRLKKTLDQKGYYVQVGSFKEEKEAETLQNRFPGSRVSSHIVKNVLYYRVTLGAYANKNIAEQEKEKIINMGHYDVFIFKK